MSDSPPGRDRHRAVLEGDVAQVGHIVIDAGAPTSGPGPQAKSTLLSLNPRPDTGAAYHQLRSNPSQFGLTVSGSK